MARIVAHAREQALAMLAARDRGKTLCPSEVARAIARDEDWRDAMPAVHAAIDGLAEEGLICLSWKGKSLAKRVGPYRISLRSKR